MGQVRFREIFIFARNLNITNMIVRIVRMEFVPDKLVAFHEIFDSSKSAIRNFEGCLHLELHQDAHHPNVRYTYSIWRDTLDLDSYRKSDLFGKVWPKTKALFIGKPLAYSLQKLEEVPLSPSETK